MIYAIIWRKEVPTVVSYLSGHEVDAESFTSISAALYRLAILKGW